MNDATHAIEALSGMRAIRVLADTVDYQARLPDPAELRVIDSGLREAITVGTDLDGYSSPGSTAEPGDLARATLLHLAVTRPDLVPVITRAIKLPSEGSRDPVTLAVGALVILALQTEVKLSRNAQRRWTFTVHKHPMRDSTLAQVISKLLAAYRPGSR